MINVNSIMMSASRRGVLQAVLQQI